MKYCFRLPQLAERCSRPRSQARSWVLEWIRGRREESQRSQGAWQYLDDGFVVVGVSEIEDDIKQSTTNADKLESRKIKADTTAIEEDARAADVTQSVTEEADTED